MTFPIRPVQANLTASAPKFSGVHTQEPQGEEFEYFFFNKQPYYLTGPDKDEFAAHLKLFNPDGKNESYYAKLGQLRTKFLTQLLTRKPILVEPEACLAASGK